MISRTSRYPSVHLGSFASYEGIHLFSSQTKAETSVDEEDECASLNEELRVTVICRFETIEERDYATANAVRKELLMMNVCCNSRGDVCCSFFAFLFTIRVKSGYGVY